MMNVLVSALTILDRFVFAGSTILIFLFIAALFFAIKDRDWRSAKIAFWAPGQYLRMEDSDNDSTAFLELSRRLIAWLHPFFILGYIVAASYNAAVSPFLTVYYLLAAGLALGYYVSPDKIKESVSSNPKGQRNLNRLKDEISNLLDRWEEELNPMQVSAKPVVLEYFEAEVSSSQNALENASSWTDDFDYSYEAHKGIYHLSICALTSGRYHISIGVLNPMGPGPHLQGFVNRYLAWAVENNYLTPEEKEKELQLLSQQIANAG